MTDCEEPQLFYLLSRCALAILGSVGVTLLVLGCVLPEPRNPYPLFVVIFYVLSPLPSLIVRCCKEDTAISSAAQEFAYFFTTGIVLSAFGLPLVLARLPALPHVMLPGTEDDGAVWSIF